jgi:predicted TIM-barrel fold metal-dependent hydrolase
MTVEQEAPDTAPRPTGRRLIDCEIHNAVPSTEALFPYLSEHWRESVTQTLFKGVADASFPRNAPTSARPEAKSGDAPPGSSLERVREQVLDRDGVEVGILTCAYAIDSLRNPDAAVAFASAVNDWQIAEWLEKEPRLRASVVVPSQLPHEAAREVERVGDHPGFVQVLLPIRSHLPYGNRIHHPMFEAIARKGLVAGLHFGGHPGNPPTPTGWPSYYVEEYVDMAGVFASQVTSIVTEGLFDQFPSLRVALLEAGFTWLPAHMWRFDKEWRNLRRLVPWVRRAPSAYIREHIRVTVQPLDAPADPRQLVQVVEQLESEEMLLYGSDYPHRHRFDPERDLLAHLPDGLASRIRHENARALYGL